MLKYPSIIKNVLQRAEIARSGFSKPILMYHGTSSKFLRSILKQGLLPNSKEGRWVEEDKGASELRRSRRSYGGVYFTRNLMTAKSSATNFDRRHNPIIVCAMIQPAAAIPDEDNYRVDFHGIPEQLFPYILVSARMKLPSESLTSLHKVMRSFVENNDPTFLQRKDKSSLFGLAREVFLTEIERRLAHRADLTKDSGFHPRYDIINAYARLDRNYKPSKGLPKQLAIKSVVDAEHDARVALDKFIKKTKNSSTNKIKSGVSDWINVRLLKPVTYKGVNKIICVIELEYGETLGISSAKVHYGKVPDDFKMQFTQRIGQLKL